MTRDNLTRALQAFMERRPFQSFRIEFMSGDRLPVTHPEVVAWRGDVLLYRDIQGLYRLFDSESVCQLLDTPPAAPA